jgi:predicted Kef-type K+ transport protein
LGICWALLARFGVDPMGFSLGLGALVLGMLYGGAELASKEARAAREAQAVGEG